MTFIPLAHDQQRSWAGLPLPDEQMSALARAQPRLPDLHHQRRRPPSPPMAGRHARPSHGWPPRHGCPAGPLPWPAAAPAPSSPGRPPRPPRASHGPPPRHGRRTHPSHGRLPHHGHRARPSHGWPPHPPLPLPWPAAAPRLPRPVPSRRRRPIQRLQPASGS